jgi:hypothetical protein
VRSRPRRRATAASAGNISLWTAAGRLESPRRTPPTSPSRRSRRSRRHHPRAPQRRYSSPVRNARSLSVSRAPRDAHAKRSCRGHLEPQMGPVTVVDAPAASERLDQLQAVPAGELRAPADAARLGSRTSTRNAPSRSWTANQSDLSSSGGSVPPRFATSWDASRANPRRPSCPRPGRACHAKRNSQVAPPDVRPQQADLNAPERPGR